jgi:hypothetical protein
MANCENPGGNHFLLEETEYWRQMSQSAGCALRFQVHGKGYCDVFERVDLLTQILFGT